jgi:ABC-2 type transport system permease protein
MSTATYGRYELLRTFRAVRFFIFSLIFPLVLYLVVAGSNRHAELGGISFPVYYMSGMVAWGSMSAVMASGARIAGERAVGWNRQLRLTPLRPPVYLATKVVTGYVMAVCSMVLLYLAGTLLGVRLTATEWISMTLMVLIGLIPFAVLGIVLGHVLTVDAVPPALGGSTALLALLGGAYGPIGQAGLLHKVIELLPSYWLVQAGKVAEGGGWWPAKAWVVIAVWTFVLVRIGMRVWQRDTARA